MRQEINFYPDSVSEQMPFFSAVVIAQSLSAVAIMMLLSYGYASQKVAGLQAELQLVANQETAALERLEKLGPIISAVTGDKSMATQLEDALRTLENKQLLLALVNGSTLGDTEGFSRHLRSLALKGVDGLWLTRITLSGTGEKTRLRGQAQRPELVPTYVQGLASEQAFAAQRFQQFQINRPDDPADDFVDFSMSSEPFAVAGLAAVR
jgi:hypothetical protein